jgi:hypothetical protein
MAHMSIAETTALSAAGTTEPSTAQGGATNSGLEAVAGVVVFAFTVLGMYLFFDAMGVATGGRPLPLGRPVIRT